MSSLQQDTQQRGATLGGASRQFAGAIAVVLALCLALKLPSWYFDHLESDERIYQALAENWLRAGRYSLQGTAILDELPAGIYDRPLFHHPPAFTLFLLPFAALNWPAGMILVPWLGHLLAVAGVAMIVWAWRRRSWSPLDFNLFLPVLAVALDPLLLFCGRKLWPDTLAAGLVAVAMGLAAVAAQRRSGGWAAMAGAAFAAAAWTKLPALFVLPAGMLLLWWSPGDTPRVAARRVLILVGVAVAMIAPWFVYFHAKCGAAIPFWTRPDAELVRVPLVARAVSRSWHYYVTEPMLVNPVVPVLLVAAVLLRRRLLSAPVGVCAAWIVLTAGGLAALGVAGQGLQLRYLTVAAPGLAALLAVLLTCLPSPRAWLAPVALAAIIYGAVNAGFYLLDGLHDEIVPVPRYLWMRLVGAAPPG